MGIADPFGAEWLKVSRTQRARATTAKRQTAQQEGGGGFALGPLHFLLSGGGGSDDGVARAVQKVRDIERPGLWSPACLRTAALCT
jgi:hypothetical protein